MSWRRFGRRVTQAVSLPRRTGSQNHRSKKEPFERRPNGTARTAISNNTPFARAGSEEGNVYPEPVRKKAMYINKSVSRLLQQREYIVICAPANRTQLARAPGRHP